MQKLSFNQECLRIYASYPITRTRIEHQEEINRFRATLHKHFTVYDPVTIDERPLHNLFKDYRDKHASELIAGHKITLEAKDRWYIPAERTLCGEEPRDLIVLGADEIDEITQSLSGAKTEIDRTIEARDFRLIDQSDCVVVYRPQFGNKGFSGGTLAEVLYARQRAHRPVFLVHDPAADGPLAPEVFDPEFISGPDVFDRIQDLSDPKKQERVLQELTDRLKEKSSELVDRRQPKR